MFENYTRDINYNITSYRLALTKKLPPNTSILFFNKLQFNLEKEKNNIQLY